MLLAIDVGNTNIVFALCEGETVLRQWRLETHSAKDAAGYAQWLRVQGLDFASVTGAVIASVVPAVDEGLRQFCQEHLKCDPLFANHETVPIAIQMPSPSQVGADRLVNGYAAQRDYGAPVIVVDFGTATTFDVVNEKGEFIGGVIAPGPNLSLKALHEATAKLPDIGIKKPPAVIGCDTMTAMQSGIFWGYVGLIEGVLARVIEEMGAKPAIIATGGLSGLFVPDIDMIEKTDPDLTLRGMTYIYENRKKK